MPKYDRELIARMLSCYDGGGYTDQAVAEQIRLLREADNLEADARTVVREVPDGMVLVPREPTEEMVAAWRSSVPDDSCAYHANDETWSAWCSESWLAMLAAASGEGVG